jgi:hypothetical protein
MNHLHVIIILKEKKINSTYFRLTVISSSYSKIFYLAAKLSKDSTVAVTVLKMLMKS